MQALTPLTHVTFSGWDGNTDLAMLRTFLEEHPQGSIEIAVLASTASQLNKERYPAVSEAFSVLSVAKESNQRTAVHLCGGLARAALAITRDDSIASNLTGTAWWPLIRDAGLSLLVDRVQVNVPETAWSGDASLSSQDKAFASHRYASSVTFARVLGKDVIIQTRDPERFPHQVNQTVSYLFDRSGGKGLQEHRWPHLPEQQTVGYAGGLDDYNAARTVARITASGNGGRFWIDMETHIREEIDPRHEHTSPPSPTRVSIAKCRQVMKIVAPYLSRQTEQT